MGRAVRPLAFAILAAALVASCALPEGPGAAVAGVRRLATFDVGAAPHGIRFSADGQTAWVALMGEGAVAVVDVASRRVVDRLPAGESPLDIVSLDHGGLLSSQFRSEGLLHASGPKAGTRESVGSGASEFSTRFVDGLTWVSCEFADEVLGVALANGSVRERWPTGERPYPPAITRDGILLFVPNRDAGTVSIIDRLNGEVAATVDVGGTPTGGALLADDTAYVVACGASNELVWINTASFEVVHRTTGVGPLPFAAKATPDGRLLLVNNAGADTVSVVDVATRGVLGEIVTGEQPIILRVHPDGRTLWVANEAGGSVSVLELPGDAAGTPDDSRPNEVLVLGTIHSGHRSSALYDLDLLREVVRVVEPDVILTEIPPNRAEEALRGFRADGAVSEPRVLRFPEYVDVVYPLLDELDFELVPCAGWTEPMARFRTARLRAIQADPARADDWAAYVAANEASDACLSARGSDDDPYLIHTDTYDACSDVALDVYDARFNAELGPGGWTQINEAHYTLIEQALDARRGQGLRVLITYGAGHKGWFRRALRQRDDIELLDATPFLVEAESNLGRL